MNLPRTPWGVEGRSVLDADGRQVAWIPSHVASVANTPDEAEPIAAAIVHAMNSHAQLLDALKAVLAAINAADDDGLVCRTPDTLRTVYASARDAAVLLARLRDAEAPQ